MCMGLAWNHTWEHITVHNNISYMCRHGKVLSMYMYMYVCINIFCTSLSERAVDRMRLYMQNTVLFRQIQEIEITDAHEVIQFQYFCLLIFGLVNTIGIYNVPKRRDNCKYYKICNLIPRKSCRTFGLCLYSLLFLSLLIFYNMSIFSHQIVINSAYKQIPTSKLNIHSKNLREKNLLLIISRNEIVLKIKTLFTTKFISEVQSMVIYLQL